MALLIESDKTMMIEACAKAKRTRNFSTSARLPLRVAAGFTLALLFTSGFGNRLQVLAQSKKEIDAALPSFEVVSIRPGHLNNESISTSDASRFAVTAVTARYLIEYAYNDFKAGAILREDELVGRPAWINSDKWAVNAKMDDRVAEKLRKLPREEEGKEMALMVRSMLGDRFKLRIHHETRIHAVYALAFSKGGPKFLNTRFTNTDVKDAQLQGPRGKPLPSVTPGMCRFWLHGNISHLAELLSRMPDISRLVLDQTGIQGNYDFVFQWKPEPGYTSMLAPSGTAGPNSGAELQTTLRVLQYSLRCRNSLG